MPHHWFGEPAREAARRSPRTIQIEGEIEVRDCTGSFAEPELVIQSVLLSLREKDVRIRVFENVGDLGVDEGWVTRQSTTPPKSVFGAHLVAIHLVRRAFAHLDLGTRQAIDTQQSLKLEALPHPHVELPLTAVPVTGEDDCLSLANREASGAVETCSDGEYGPVQSANLRQSRSGGRAGTGRHHEDQALQ
jgi:hypothetical protein